MLKTCTIIECHLNSFLRVVFDFLLTLCWCYLLFFVPKINNSKNNVLQVCYSTEKALFCLVDMS